MSTFNYPFDYTFRPEFDDSTTPPTQTGCRRDGVYLTWLTLQGGWEYWLFEGNALLGKSSSSVGQAEQGGLVNQSQKKIAPTMLLHTANLTKEEALKVGTLWESISAYWLKHKDDNTIERIRVTLPVGDLQLWDPQTFTNNFSIAITLPYRRSQLI